MAQTNWIIWIIFICVFMPSVRSDNHDCSSGKQGPSGDWCSSDDEVCTRQKLVNCSNHNVTYLVMADVNRTLFLAQNFSQAFCDGGDVPKLESDIFVQTTTFSIGHTKWLKAENQNGCVLLHLNKWYFQKNLNICVLFGENCSEVVNQTNVTGTCRTKCCKTNHVCDGTNGNEIVFLKMTSDDGDSSCNCYSRGNDGGSDTATTAHPSSPSRMPPVSGPQETTADRSSSSPTGPVPISVQQDEVCTRQNLVNCSNHNVAYLVMANVNRTLFLTYNFSQAFCDDGDVLKLESNIFVQTTTFPMALTNVKRKWAKLENRNGFVLLHLTKWHIRRNLNICVLIGENCSKVVKPTNGDCSMQCLETNHVCDGASYDESVCLDMNDQNTYFVNVTANECINCNNPVKKPEVEYDLKDVMTNVTSPAGPEQALDSGIADKVMDSFTSDFVEQFNESTVGLTLGKSVKGVLVKQIDPWDMEAVSFGYCNITEDFNIVEDKNALSRFPKSVSVPKEAFEKALSSNISKPFVVVFSFLNMSKDEHNSTVLADEVSAIVMGAEIKNLTDTININWNMNSTGIPSCRSWNGNGSRPVWTDDGCETVAAGPNITCRCTHLTFFAVLLTPLNETISTNDLNTLTIITRVGCGISMFFLGIVLFMHFVWRRARSSKSTKILIQLVLAMFLLDFAFLINDFVAKTKNVIGCKIMAAAMHYFMLSTFTWFAVHAFHLCLQLYKGGKIEIQRYVLKVSITSWVMPSVIGIVLLSIGKYGEVVISTGNAATSVAMCWILDNKVHYIVNIGYYALVFILTFSTFVLMLTWLYCVTPNQRAAAQGKRVSSCQRIITIMGLCCILGVTWGCAFFAYGIFRVPAYYCFTVLNSFQGFCLFIYYYKTSHMVETKDPHSSSSSSTTTTTLKTNLDEIFNPYDNYITKPKPE